MTIDRCLWKKNSKWYICHAIDGDECTEVTEEVATFIGQLEDRIKQLELTLKDLRVWIDPQEPWVLNKIDEILYPGTKEFLQDCLHCEGKGGFGAGGDIIGYRICDHCHGSGKVTPVNLEALREQLEEFRKTRG